MKKLIPFLSLVACSLVSFEKAHAGVGIELGGKHSSFTAEQVENAIRGGVVFEKKGNSVFALVCTDVNAESIAACDRFQFSAFEEVSAGKFMSGYEQQTFFTNEDLKSRKNFKKARKEKLKDFRTDLDAWRIPLNVSFGIGMFFVLAHNPDTSQSPAVWLTVPLTAPFGIASLPITAPIALIQELVATAKMNRYIHSIIKNKTNVKIKINHNRFESLETAVY